MPRTALVHSYPQWEPPENDPTASIEDYVETWRGKMRIVRSRKRARVLRRRGVPLWDLRERGKRLWLWFVEEAT